jgi:hypothetical protein
MRSEFAAFVAALDTASSAPVYKAGAVPNTPPAGYMVVTPTVPRPSDYSHAATRGSARHRYVVMYVGNSADSALFRAEEADTLIDSRLTITGKACSPIKREAGRPVDRDPDVEGVFSGADTFVFATTNA